MWRYDANKVEVLANLLFIVHACADEAWMMNISETTGPKYCVYVYTWENSVSHLEHDKNDTIFHYDSSSTIMSHPLLLVLDTKRPTSRFIQAEYTLNLNGSWHRSVSRFTGQMYRFLFDRENTVVIHDI